MSPERNLNTEPATRARLLTALYIAQEQYGYLSPEALERVAQRLELTPGEVYSTASFYTLYDLEPQAEHRIQVCEGLSCGLTKEGDALLPHIRDKLGLKKGETRTRDQRFSVETVQCLAACDTAPNVRINDQLHTNVTLEQLDNLLDGLMEG
jgi:NADH:ubiquinone oxidoreductase subunit E